MGAALDDAAVVQYHDGVGVAHGGQPVGDDEDGAAVISASMPCWTIASVRVSIELVASSRIITGGSATAARAMASSWRWPWLRLAPLPRSMVL